MLNDDYIALIKNLISDFEKNNPKGHVTPHIRWETLKCVIRGETIKYCFLLKKTFNKEQSVLESKLEAMESNLLSCGPKQKEEILNNINLTQNDLNKLIEIKTKGAATRSRARWMESGEKNTKYFLHLEKWHLEKKSIKSLRSAQGRLIDKQEDILKELLTFYESLYFENQQCCEKDCCDFIRTLSLPSINKAKFFECEKLITDNECQQAILQLANNKSPGLDGFSIEFYKTFWIEIRSLFMECLDFSKITNQLSKSQYDGVITLLPKPGKDKLSPFKYRPITLLNCDYKIISKVITNRIHPCLNDFIEKEQNGFMKARNIGDNIRLLFDIIDYANHEKMLGAVLLVDLHKAFDSLHWSFIFTMLKSYGFGNSLINWIRILYKNPKCRVVNNNFLSPLFEVKKGVRQGDPLSPTIFLLCIECLAIMLRQSRQYKGIKLNQQTFKVSLFVDNIAIFLNGNALQFNYVFDILDTFGQKSGCKVNMSKSNAFCVGSSKSNFSQPFSDKGLSWPQTLVKYLGVNIPITNFDNNFLFSENFPGITREVQTLLNIWSSRGLTLLGKITILKSLVIPKIVYKATYLPVTLPETFIKELNQIMYKFIWGSKWEKIGRSQLCCDVKEGGGKMIDIKQYVLSLRHNFIFKLFDNNYQSSWKSLEHRCIDENVLFCILRSNIKLNSMLIVVEWPFYALPLPP